MIKIGVWLTFPDNERIHAGEMVSDGKRGAFRYSPDFIDRPKAFPLDPVTFPLQREPFNFERRDGVAAVFEDSLPDDWGRRLLVRRAELPRNEQTLPHLLLALGATGIGALSFAAEGELRPSASLPTIPDLSKLLDATRRFEEGEAFKDEEWRLLLNAGSSAGGARPKALILDGDNLAIAKFPSRNDSFSIVPIEAAAMSLAREAKIVTPETRLVKCGSRDALIVRRFDQTPEGGRRHMISFQTLLRADDWYQLGYIDLFDVLRKVSAQPEIDLPALFRQMVFNAVIGNTDDHLKNFALLHDDRGYYLSPAYDILPNVSENIEHVLHFSHGHICPGRRSLINLGTKIGVSSPAVIIDQILGVLINFQEQTTMHGVPEKEISRLWPRIDRNIVKCK